MPFAVDAAGLGKLTVLSGLGEPLNAEIELTASKEELSALTARIAPADVYAEQGMDRPASLGLLHLEVGKQASGASVIKLTSVQPVNDPFLDMLIQVEWPSGRLLREYTALLDPPGFGDQKIVPSAVAPVVSSSTGQAASKPSSKPASAKRSTASSQAAKSEPTGAATSAANTGEAYTTRQGDTLRSVARQMQVDGVSLEQMLVGLYQTNKDAFVDGNMNRMKAGQIMHAPTSEQLQSISQQDALQEIRVHTSDWHAYRNKLAGQVAQSVPEGEAGKGQSSSGKITAPAEDKSAPAASGPRDVVKLSKGESPATKSGAAETPSSKQEKVNAARDDEVAREKAAREAEAKVSSLEKQVQDMQKLLQLKNQSLTELQQKKAPAGQTVTPATSPAPETKKPEQVPAPTPTQPAEAAKPAESAAKPAEATPPAPAAIEPKVEPPKKPRKHRQPPPVVEPEPQSGPDILDDPLMMGSMGGALLALLGAGWLYLRNKRRRSLDSFEQGILTTSGLKPNTVFGNSTGGMVDTGDTSFLTDLAHGGLGMIDTNDVDPIAEAEVYMAYGRDVQAEEILKDAISKDPKRHELHQKLLEIYSHRKDTGAFETLAGELYATLGATDPMWQKIATMGHAIEPTNPLYQADGIPAGLGSAAEKQASEPSAAVFDTPAPGETVITSFPPEPMKSDLAPEGAQAEAPLDLGLDFPGMAEGIVDQPKADSPEVLPDLDMQNTIIDPGMGNVSADNALDFSLELPEPAQEENVLLDAADLGMDEELAVSADTSPVLDEIPQLESVTAETETQPEGAVEDISFDLPVGEMGTAELTAVESSTALEPPFDIPEVAEVAAESGVPAKETEPTVDLEEISAVTFDMPEEIALDQVGEAGMVQDIPLELPSLDLDEEPAQQASEKSGLDEATVERPAEEIVIDSVPDEESVLDFNFDVDAEEMPSETSASDEPIAPVLPDLNLSGISLDLGEPEKAVEAQAFPEASTPETDEVIEEITLAESESSDVDTKLDLVSAYMDMGDTEGARELLEEVLREGGPMQRERAQGLLNNLA